MHCESEPFGERMVVTINPPSLAGSSVFCPGVSKKEPLDARDSTKLVEGFAASATSIRKLYLCSFVGKSNPLFGGCDRLLKTQATP
jgi:hypothetical protein